MRILIAEDNITSRLILEKILQKWGYEVVCTRDGCDAWNALQKEDAPRLVILDCVMPGMDGLEVCRRTRQLRTEQPFYIIILTALERKEDVVAGLTAGANDYVTKPYDNEELRARIQVGRRVIELQNALANRIKELQQALAHIKTLQGVLPICMHCHKIRDDAQSWQLLENYIQEHSDAQLSHALCPECLEKYYPASSDEG